MRWHWPEPYAAHANECLTCEQAVLGCVNPGLEAACCCCTDGQSVCLCGTFTPTEPPAYAQTWEGVNTLTDKCCIVTLLRKWYSVRRGSSHVIQSFVEQNERLHVTYQNNDL